VVRSSGDLRTSVGETVSLCCAIVVKGCVIVVLSNAQQLAIRSSVTAMIGLELSYIDTAAGR
jgi:hypothetical protein